MDEPDKEVRRSESHIPLPQPQEQLIRMHADKVFRPVQGLKTSDAQTTAVRTPVPVIIENQAAPKGPATPNIRKTEGLPTIPRPIERVDSEIEAATLPQPAARDVKEGVATAVQVEEAPMVDTAAPEQAVDSQSSVDTNKENHVSDEVLVEVDDESDQELQAHEHEAVIVTTGIEENENVLFDMDKAHAEVATQGQEALPLVLVELFKESEKSDGTIEPGERITAIEGLEADEDIEQQSSGAFVIELVEYVESLPKKPELTAEEQPAAIIGQVVEAAIKIQGLHESDIASTEAVQEAAEELEMLCTKLLESLGIDPDKKVVAKMVEKILTSDLSDHPYRTLSVHELAERGTHEYKLEDWFKHALTLGDTVHMPQLVGGFAVRSLV